MIKITLWSVLLAGCAGMPSLFEEPGVTVTSIALRNSNTFSPEFDIKLRITNPNRFALHLVGMSYTLDLAGNRVLSGVSNDLPVIDPYGEAVINLTAAVSLLGSVNLIRDLMNRNQERFDYVFNTRLDVGGSLPQINVRRSGELPLQ
jgi:LEA14-like dessication related protein